MSAQAYRIEEWHFRHRKIGQMSVIHSISMHCRGCIYLWIPLATTTLVACSSSAGTSRRQWKTASSALEGKDARSNSLAHPSHPPPGRSTKHDNPSEELFITSRTSRTLLSQRNRLHRSSRPNRQRHWCALPRGEHTNLRSLSEVLGKAGSLRKRRDRRQHLRIEYEATTRHLQSLHHGDG